MTDEVSYCRGPKAEPGRIIPVCALDLILFAIYIDAYWRGVICSRSGSFLARESEEGVVTKVVEKGLFILYLYQGTDAEVLVVVVNKELHKL